jgi:hypothetical protein
MKNAVSVNRLAQWSFSLLLVLTLAACSVHLIAAYDEVFDKAAAETQKKIAHLMEGLRREGSPERHYSRAAKDYADINADLHSLRVRAEANAFGAPNDESIKIVDTILANMQLLEEQHRRKPAGLSVAFVDTAQSTIDLQFVALIQLELAKRR